ncbi:DUF4232 domain-containing protein [Streptomyces griseoaurantiacus]|uniref:DUF4232 domain-containing protein n=1 Tax=Streptomyces griseoaurantiacus M045 TaxID=996637 RepID=F3NKG1_9ACTN|nr:DUF4232 domain-containing protein [Streptomyces griseoaurantiacus]EGG46120.1 hypothetical protein SGM_3625 [Streptomyces griseoaurantiacus M045]
MSGNRRKALLVSVAIVSGAMLMTACQDGDTSGDVNTDTSASQGSSSSGKTEGKTAGSGEKAASSGQSAGKTDKDGQSADGSGADTGDGTRAKVEQTCGANDISWSTKAETQAGGYILITAKAKSGITCWLPAALPTVAFGSGGTEAGPAEQSVGKQIKLSGGTAAYAGVQTKTTNSNNGVEYDSLIVGVGKNDPNPVSLPVDSITVDKPIVTNWHTAPADAVPFN